ncbi:preprotein translocase subunit SecA [Rhodococcoides kroppenstedtii]|uniref:Protein translocase subunit SecA n=1 Tax=Rhodococcoides kroppenstedtii TaxID=293050 RepID=A0ABS7NRK1_9NOCA|nr:preprotein translocase subunit SecA [Rhodococcus kroppenstedtii]MBY6312693.1 preprotein translocase subunit SecA [Rhodococcus kroppenstedtii]MBY6320639.1 preprotein translocase subunit SecA [Rhodococcus kroppenstedtii]MBY6399450.1 preprotein translocase subunit SecA [Rhodococcus kroppenstedtii]
MPSLSLSKLLRVGEGRMVKRLKHIADHVSSLSPDVEGLTDAELRGKTDEFRTRIEGGETLDDLLPEAFAVAREASKRVLSQRHFDVQVMGGAALHFGNIAEMKTGEGKTLTCVLPAYLNALSGDGVHVVTVNDYLAKRDSEWMGRVHRFLGLSVDVILSGMTPAERRAAYAADITYGTNNEFGFDYLRDNMTHSLDDLVQRGHNFAIVDEVDSILIDEARTPLIISGPADASSKWYAEFARIAPLMKKDLHYEVDIKKRTVGVHEAGVEFVEDQLGIDNLYEAANSPLVSYLNNAVKAKELYQRDKDYIVRDGDVIIVDEFTGRILVGRRYNEGMHQAIEAKEKVEIKAENQTLATITLQNYFRLYDKLSGMTGTAETEAAELHQIYSLGVIPIPTNRPMVRVDNGDLIYKSEEAKFAAVVDDVVERHEKGQPVLIGTTSVERSEYLSKQFTKRGVPHNVLNAKFHEQEATIIAEAGRSGAVTVATNMAGRGTDVVLGGNPDILADLALRSRGLDPVESAEDYEQAWEPTLEEVKSQVKAEAEKVREAGGLYVLGTERHDSRRIDNQLRGRSGRQGDPGESRFYLSLGDELMRRFNGAALESIMTRLNLPDDVPIEAKMVSKAIKSTQTQVEQQNFEIRKNVLKYDEVMNQQRTVIYEERRRILRGEDMEGQVEQMITDVVTAYVDGATAEGYVEDWDLDQLWTALKTLYPVGVDQKELTQENEFGEKGDLSRDELREALLDDARSAYARREAEIDAIAGEGGMRELERRVLLSVLDRKWREHLYEMDYLKEGIGLRAMAQRDPLVEYQREGYDMFTGMLDGLKEESVGFLFNLQVEASAPSPAASAGLQVGAGLQNPVAARAAASAAATGATPTPAPPAAPTPAAGPGAPAGRDASPTREPATVAAEKTAPPALRARGLDERDPSRLTYSGPDESGGTSVRRASTDGGAAEKSTTTRRERREAARNTVKPVKRGAKSKRRK